MSRSNPIINVQPATAPSVTVEAPQRDYRKELWIAIAAGIASCENCRKIESPALFANAALDAFDARFHK